MTGVHKFIIGFIVVILIAIFSGGSEERVKRLAEEEKQRVIVETIHKTNQKMARE